MPIKTTHSKKQIKKTKNKKHKKNKTGEYITIFIKKKINTKKVNDLFKKT